MFILDWSSQKPLFFLKVRNVNALLIMPKIDTLNWPKNPSFWWRKEKSKYLNLEYQFNPENDLWVIQEWRHQRRERFKNLNVGWFSRICKLWMPPCEKTRSNLNRQFSFFRYWSQWARIRWKQNCIQSLSNTWCSSISMLAKRLSNWKGFRFHNV